MNIALPIQTQKISTEAAQLLAILRDCGIDNVWLHPEAKLLAFYLRNTAVDAKNIRLEIGPANYANFVNHVSCQWTYAQRGPEISVRHWFLKYANGHLLKQALQVSAQENLNTPPALVVYDEQHPDFARDEKEFGKRTTLLILEDFPTQIFYNQDYLINQFNFLQHFQRQHGDTRMLYSFRRSIMRKEANNVAHLRKSAATNGKELKPKTSGASQYLKLNSYDRLRLMRYYQFICGSDRDAAM
jgi:hypothetical protein